MLNLYNLGQNLASEPMQILKEYLKSRAKNSKLLDPSLSHIDDRKLDKRKQRNHIIDRFCKNEDV